jgi:DNA polymerase-3 subunit delta'
MFDDFQDTEDEFGAYEPDLPEGLPLPRYSALCLGHEHQEKALLELINAGSMPHAIIFNGPKGIGKSTMAYRLARHLLKHGASDPNQDSLFGDVPADDFSNLDVNEEDSVFRKVASGGHPDLLTIERAVDEKKGHRKASLDVETARKVVPFLRMTSSDGGWRIVIVDDADTMNRNAQNALLKILEEPPNNTVLILICHRLGAMIPTIRSRCRVLNFDPLNQKDFETLIEREVGSTLSAHQLKILAAMANGSVGTAREIIESNGLETADTVLSIIKQWPDLNQVDIHHLADTAGRPGQDGVFKDIERTFLFITENLSLAKARNTGSLQLPLEGEAFLQLLNQHTLDFWLTRHEALTDHFRQAQYANLDKRLAVIGAFNLLFS